MASLDFITSEDFRASLEADYRELRACLDAEAWKAVHVLSGSILEALLIDSLLAHSNPGLTEQQILKTDLAGIIEQCKAKGIISQRAADLSSVVRSYRNLIHPGRVVRLGETVDADGAKVALALVDMIVKEIAAVRRTTYGFTAEQIVSKIGRDPGSIAILDHLLKEVNAAEMERLLLKILPTRYLELAEAESETSPEDFAALEQGFRTALNLSPDTLKAKLAQRFVAILKEESGHTVSAYRNAFFTAALIDHLSAKDAALVKGHLLTEVKTGLKPETLRVYEGIGKYLEPGEVVSLVDPVVRLILKLQRESKDHEPIRLYLMIEYSSMKADVQEALENRLEQWVNLFRERNQEALAQTINQLKDSLSPDVPF